MEDLNTGPRLSPRKRQERCGARIHEIYPAILCTLLLFFFFWTSRDTARGRDKSPPGDPLTPPFTEPQVASLMLTLGLAPVPFHPTPSFWENEVHSLQDEAMRWLRAGTKHLCSQTLRWGGGGGRQVCSLGIVGAAAPPCPSSGALRTPVSSIFPSHWSEGGERRVQQLDGFVSGRR